VQVLNPKSKTTTNTNPNNQIQTMGQAQVKQWVTKYKLLKKKKKKFKTQRLTSVREAKHLRSSVNRIQ
jgi:inorganic pyrophosphatase